MQQWVKHQEANKVSDKAVMLLAEFWHEITPLSKTSKKQQHDLDWWRRFPICLSVYEMVEFLTNYKRSEDISIIKKDDVWYVEYMDYSLKGKNLCTMLWGIVKQEVEK